MSAREFDVSEARLFRDRRPICLQPGPIEVSEAVQAAFQAPPVSHRHPDFHAELARIKELLRRLTGAPIVELLLGTGTHANDAVAAQLSLRAGRGLILVNGEFGERLTRHAAGAGLEFETLELPWGTPLDPAVVRARLGELVDVTWIWACHCETSTGLMVDIPALVALAREEGVELCLDSVSSLGLLEVDLDGVALASGVSGKGVGAYPGLAWVLASAPFPDSGGRLPRCLDLGLYAAQGGVPFTSSWNLLAALGAALEERLAEPRWRVLPEIAARLREALKARGLPPLFGPEGCSPAVLTLAVPAGRSSLEVGARLERRGYLLAYQSEYLVTRGWMQICLMGRLHEGDLAGLPEALAGAIGVGA